MRNIICDIVASYYEMAVVAGIGDGENNAGSALRFSLINLRVSRF